MDLETAGGLLHLTKDTLPRIQKLVRLVMGNMPLDEHTALALLFMGVDAVVKCGAEEATILNTVKHLLARGLGTETEPS